MPEIHATGLILRLLMSVFYHSQDNSAVNVWRFEAQRGSVRKSEVVARFFRRRKSTEKRNRSWAN